MTAQRATPIKNTLLNCFTVKDVRVKHLNKEGLLTTYYHDATDEGKTRNRLSNPVNSSLTIASPALDMAHSSAKPSKHYDKIKLLAPNALTLEPSPLPKAYAKTCDPFGLPIKRGYQLLYRALINHSRLVGPSTTLQHLNAGLNLIIFMHEGGLDMSGSHNRKTNSEFITLTNASSYEIDSYIYRYLSRYGNLVLHEAFAFGKLSCALNNLPKTVELNAMNKTTRLQVAQNLHQSCIEYFNPLYQTTEQRAREQWHKEQKKRNSAANAFNHIVPMMQNILQDNAVLNRKTPEFKTIGLIDDLTLRTLIIEIENITVIRFLNRLAQRMRLIQPHHKTLNDQ